MPDPQQQQTSVKPPPPPGYMDVEAKPAPPPGYTDVDAQSASGKSLQDYMKDANGPSEQSTASTVWEAANKPIGKDVNEKYQTINGKVSDWIAMHAPPSMAGPATQIARAPLDIIGAIAEAGRRTLSPLGIASMGGGAELQALKQAPNVSQAIKSGVGALETGTGVGFAANAAKQAVTPRQPGETGSQEFERRVGGVGQAMLGTAPMLHGASELTPGVGSVQKVLGVGPDFTAQAVKDWQTKAGEVTASNKESLLRARGEHESKVSDIENSNKTAQQAAQNKWEAKARAISDANNQGISQVAERRKLESDVQQHTSDLMEHLPQVADDAKAEAKAKYAAVGVKGTADPAELYGKIQDVVSDKLKGVGGTPPVLAKILNELKPESEKDLLSQATVFLGAGARDPLVDNRPLSTYPQDFQRRYLTSNPPQLTRGIGFHPSEPNPGPTEPPDFNRLHEFMHDLGDAAAKSKAPDEQAALWSARSVIDSSMRKLSDTEGKTADFKDAQSTYNQYFNTFKKTWKDQKGEASPIARALQSKDPVNGQILPGHATDILLRDKNYALAKQMLDRYPAARTDLLKQLKDKTDRIKGLPETFEPKPLPTQAVAARKPMPSSQSLSLKKPPQPLDVQGQKAELLRKKAELLGGFTGRGMFIDAASIIHFLTTGNPAALSIPIGRRLAAKAIKAGAKGRLVGVTPAEQTMLKTTQVYPNKTAAAAALKGQKDTR